MKWLRYCFPTFVFWGEWLRDHLTRGGLVLAALLPVCLPFVLDMDLPLIHLFSAVVSLFVVAFVANYLFRPKLSLRWQVTPLVRRGDWVKIQLTISNQSPWAAYGLETELLEAPDSWERAQRAESIPVLEPGQSVSRTLLVRPLQRGVFPYPAVKIGSTFPFNLFHRWGIFLATGELSVYPHTPEYAREQLAQSIQQGMGEHMEEAAISRGWNEYIGNREYQPGVPVRRWDYASWARLGRPIVREYLDAQPTAAALVVDTFAATNGAPLPGLEGALSLSLWAAEELMSQGWSIHQFLCGEQVAEAAHDDLSLDLESIRRLLAQASSTAIIEENSVWSSLRSESPDTAIYLFLSAWDQQRAKLCQALSRAGISWQGWVVATELTEAIPVPANLTIVPVEALAFRA